MQAPTKTETQGERATQISEALLESKQTGENVGTKVGKIKLFVDDLREPYDSSWTVARKVEQAVSLISRFDCEAISLDHDIEGRPDDETFKPVAYMIGEKYFTSKLHDEIQGLYVDCPRLYPEIIIHSSNTIGAKQMESILESYGIKCRIQPYHLL